LAVGLVAYGVDLPASRIPALILVVAVGALSFCCLGFALAAVIRSRIGRAGRAGDRAALYFISGVFVPVDQIPDWLLGVADVRSGTSPRRWSRCSRRRRLELGHWRSWRSGGSPGW
jgi:ABC-2 type transport system permease protein